MMTRMSRGLIPALALASTLAIAACTLPASMAPGEAGRMGSQQSVKQGGGSLAVTVRWPYRTQAIPSRATRMVLRLTRAASPDAVPVPGEPAVLGLDGAPVPELVVTRDEVAPDSPPTRTWSLPEQENVRVTADLYNGEALIGSGQRVIDVVAGVRSHVGLEVVLNDPEAPHLTAISTDSFGPGDVLGLTVANLGTEADGWSHRVFLQLEENEPLEPGAPDRPAYIQRFDLEDVERVGETALSARIPASIGEALWRYYRNPERMRLLIGAEVDGVSTELIRVFPKDPKLTTTVTLSPGPTAPPRDAGVPEVDLEESYLTGANREHGSEWVYRVRETGRSDVDLTVRIVWRDGEERWYGDAELFVSPEGVEGAGPHGTNLWEDPHLGFMTRLYGADLVYSLAPSSDAPDLLRYAYTTRPAMSTEDDPWGGAQREVWFKAGVGVVRIRDVRLRPTPDGPVREVREFELLSHPVSPTPTPDPTPFEKPTSNPYA